MFKGLGNLSQLSGMLKQAMQMKEKMEEIKEELGRQTVEVSSGGGMVKVVVSGKFEVLSLTIDPEVINREEAEVLETLVRAAINEGIGRVHELVKAKMGEITGGLEIPGLI